MFLIENTFQNYGINGFLCLMFGLAVAASVLFMGHVIAWSLKNLDERLWKRL